MAGLQERVAVPASRDEIGRLGVTLNAMLDRIERGVTYRHRLVADASHELRTPLAIMRAEIDVSLRGDVLPPTAREVLESAREEVDRMSRTVDNLLALAEADEGGLELLTVPVDLRQAIEDAAERLRLLAAAEGVVSSCPTAGRWRRRRIRNGCTWPSRTSSRTRSSSRRPAAACTSLAGAAASEVGVTVTRRGAWHPARRISEHLFDRYYQLDRAPDPRLGGSGLGLSISRDVAVAHGGRLWADSSPGAGSTFTFALPSWRADEGDNRD